MDVKMSDIKFFGSFKYFKSIFLSLSLFGIIRVSYSMTNDTYDFFLIVIIYHEHDVSILTNFQYEKTFLI